jgi:phosphonate transport system substrate-binding protein
MTGRNVNALPVAAFRRGLSREALAAIRVWGESVARCAGLAFDGDSAPSLNPADLLHTLRNRKLDGVVLTAPEYVAVAGILDATFFSYEILVEHGEQYLTLVHARSAIETSRLAPKWLATRVAAQTPSYAEPFFGRVTKEAKLAQIVLPVYFRKADACIVTRQGFETMCELNPQLRGNLRVLASSPRLLRFLGGYRQDCPAPLKARGQQALMFFQVRRLTDRLQAKAPGRTP